MIHYAAAIEKFGPPKGFWTARFESKHRVSKNLAEAAKNFKNISLTLADRQQRRLASVYYRGMFTAEKFELPTRVARKKDFPTNTEFQKQIHENMGYNDIICDKIMANQQDYKVEDVVVLLVKDRYNIEVGLIKTIMVKKKKIYFFCEKFEATRNSLEYFVTGVKSDSLQCIDLDTLADFKPLIKRGTSQKFKFVLHHNVSFDHLYYI